MPAPQMPKDTHESEAFTPEAMEYLTARQPAVALALQAWFEAHAGHERRSLEWWKHEDAPRWEVHARCGQCDLNSGQYDVEPA